MKKLILSVITLGWLCSLAGCATDQKQTTTTTTKKRYVARESQLGSHIPHAFDDSVPVQKYGGGGDNVGDRAFSSSSAAPSSVGGGVR